MIGQEKPHTKDLWASILRSGGAIEECWSASLETQPQIILPDGCVDVLEKEGGLWVVGPMTCAKWVTLSASPVRGLRLRPAMVRAWLGISPEELLDVVVSARELPVLRNMHHLEEVAPLLREVSRPSRIGRAIDVLCQTPNVRIDELAKSLELSQRHLRRLFTVEVGLSPKVFARVQRLQALIRKLPNQRRGSLADLAYDAGYADQAHMSREVKTLSGIRPTQLLRLMSDLFKNEN